MNDQLQQALALIIQKALSGMDQAQGFIAGQLPDVVQQVLAWNLTKDVLFFVICAICIAVSTWQLIRIAPKHNPNSFYHDKSLTIFMFIASICISIATGLFNAMDALQIYIAPKVWLIEYAAHLVKK